jgi:hypothetical protein
MATAINDIVTTIGLDLGKNVFHIVGMNAPRRSCVTGTTVSRQTDETSTWHHAWSAWKEDSACDARPIHRLDSIH